MTTNPDTALYAALVFAGIWILLMLVMARAFRKENKRTRKTVKHVHDQYITDTLLEREHIPQNLEDQDMAVQCCEWPHVDMYKSCN